MKKRLFLIIILTIQLFSKENLIFYCGITMVKPMIEISKIIEKKYNCNVIIIQGGSKDLYDSLSSSKKGDLYLPGSEYYIKKYEKFNYFGYRKYIGYNQLAIFVSKENSKKIKDLNDLLNSTLKTSIGNPKTCSIGTATVHTLKKFKNQAFLNRVEDEILIYSSDSRDLNQLIKSGRVDLGINWRATAYFPENRNKITIIPINEKYAKKYKLFLVELTFTKHHKIAKAFIDLASSETGKNIMKKYGFLDE